MHRTVGALALSFAVTSPTASLTADRREEPVVSIRIHDYVHLPGGGLARAQQVVSQLYEAINVRATWLESQSKTDGVAGDCGAHPDRPSDLTIIILTPAMASRRVIPAEVLGYAATEPGRGGRIAFVLYDRLRVVAEEAAVDRMRLMGIVMAHEIGHLLLTLSHSADGLMRARWEPADFRAARPVDLQFSTSQMGEIRLALGAAAGLEGRGDQLAPPMTTKATRRDRIDVPSRESR